MPNSNDFNRFDYADVGLDIKRSVFNMPFNHKFTFNVGDVIPFFWQFCVPGDTYEVDTSKVIRTSPFIAPVMDDVYLDTYYFFVPMRLVFNKTKEFFGENTTGPWVQQTQYTFPKLRCPEDKIYSTATRDYWGFKPGTIGDYLGIPAYSCVLGQGPYFSQLDVNALPFRTYALICNEWFRDENLMNPIAITLGTGSTQGENTADQVTDIQKGGHPFIAAKYHDYFTSALPEPQKGADVTFMQGFVPVYPTNDMTHFAEYNKSANSMILNNKPNTVQYKVSKSFVDHAINNTTWIYGAADASVGDLAANYSESSNRTTGLKLNGGASFVSGATSTPAFASLVPSNLGADLNVASGNTISALRIAFAMQRYFERLARGGSRYTEFVNAFFGVQSKDSRLQRPEYLGGNRIPLNISSVVQTSESATTPQGNVAGYSHTSDDNHDFLYSCTEHGYIMGVTVARYKHTYAQGVERHFFAKDVYDIYNPVFANLSEQPIFRYELFYGVDNEFDPNSDMDVFGYQECWADYRYKPNRVSGLMRPGVPNSLAYWNFSDYYDGLPALSADWIREDKTNVDRALAVTSSVSDQLIADFLVNVRAVRPMPLYSIPGLVDHN